MVTWNRACSFCYGETPQPYLPPLNAQFTETLQTENFTCSLPLTLLLHGRSKLPMCSKLPHFTLLSLNVLPSICFSDLDSQSLRGSCNQHHPSRFSPMKATYSMKSPAKQGDRDAVQFYHSFEPYFEFTNFYPRNITIFEKRWPTTEHFFQAQKFAGTPIEDKIRCCKSAREAFETARRRDYQPWIRRDWHSPSVKDKVMLLAVRSKFAQHKDLQDILFKTGSKGIVEHTSNDSYWGDGGDGTGQNKLGKILVQVREELDPDGSKRKNIKRTGSGRRERSGSVDRQSRQTNNNYVNTEQHKERRPRSRSSTRDAKDKTSEQSYVLKYSEQKYRTSDLTIQTVDRNSTNRTYADVVKTQPMQRQVNSNRTSGSPVPHSSHSRGPLVSCQGYASPSTQRRGNDSTAMWSCLNHS